MKGDYKQQSISGLLKIYGEKIEKAAMEALQENAEMVVAEAKSRCPVKTGKLQESIHAEPKGKNKIRIVADAQNDRDGYYYGGWQEYAPDGKEFLHPALKAVKPKLKQNMIDKIRAALKI